MSTLGDDKCLVDLRTRGWTGPRNDATVSARKPLTQCPTSSLLPGQAQRRG
jgi:hypothetical protein